RLLEDIGMRAVPHKAAHIQCFRYRLDELSRVVDDGDVIVFLSQPLGDAASDLSGTANEYLHVRLCDLEAYRANGRRFALRKCDEPHRAGGARQSPCPLLILSVKFHGFFTHAEKLELSVQGRALHADECRRLRDVSAKS